MQRNKQLKKFVLCAVLIAMQVILSRYAGIQTQFVQTSLGFVAIAVAASMLGYGYGIACAAISDFLGTVIAGTGPYFPLFTINAILFSLVYSFFFYKKERTVLGIVLATVIQNVVISIPLTPVWLYFYYNYFLNVPKIFALMSTQQMIVRLVEIPIKIVVLIPICKYLLPKLEKELEI